MSCYRPKTAYEMINRKTPNGKKLIVFSVDNAQGKPYKPLDLPCGKCVGCLLDRSRSWAIRSVHEASQYGDRNIFITLTFNRQNININNSLVKEDWQNFMKRLRKRFVRKDAYNLQDPYTDFIRYFHCGEYGSKGDRPHHHACLFNFRPDDLYLWKVREKVPLYRSESLEEVWAKPIQPEEHSNYDIDTLFMRHGKYYAKLGYVTVGEVTWESAAYCARYVLKKQFGKVSYEDIDHETGEVSNRIPEYCTMSNRPGIGRQWIEKYWSDFFPKNYLFFNGRKLSPPKYYDRIVDELQPSIMKGVRECRQAKARETAANRDWMQLQAAEEIKLQAITKLERIYENDSESLLCA